jgi:Bacterial Ig-like domain (group 3)
MLLWAMVAMFCASATQAFASGADDGEGTMTVLPIMVPTGTTNNYAFSFRAPNSGNFDAGSRVTLRIPAGWTAPQTNDPSIAGFVHVSPVLSLTSVAIRSISGGGPWTITIDLTTRQKGAGFTLTYFTVVAPTNGGVCRFQTQTKTPSGVLTPLVTGSPTVTLSDPKKFVTSTLLTTSANPAVNGQPVTFTAIVSSLAIGTPSGTVTFWDGDTVLGTDTVHAAGLASLTIDEFSHGEDGFHWITAEYSGNNTFNGNISGTLPQVVIAPPPPPQVIQAPTVSLSFNPDRSVNLQCSGAAGQTYMVQATSNPVTGPWVTISTNVIGTNGTCLVNDPYAAQCSSRFYRTVVSY